MSRYLMENRGERLERDLEALWRQLTWAGLRPGVRVLEAGCGPGLTSAVAPELVQPGGSVLGLDLSEERIATARRRYGRPGLAFEVRDLPTPLDDLGPFDLIWSRSLLEYHRWNPPSMARTWSSALRPGGWMCLADLDGNGLGIYGMPPELERVHSAVQPLVATRMDFDAHVGRERYAMRCDLGFEGLEVCAEPHHLLEGAICEVDLVTWRLEAQALPAVVEAYPGGREGFLADWASFLVDPRRFIHRPLLVCRGLRPAPGAGPGYGPGPTKLRRSRGTAGR